MNISNQFLTKIFVFAGIIALIANSGGVPQAVTKAPGETGSTCNACHTSPGSFNPTISLDIMDQDSTLVAAYTPGQKYILSLNIAGQNNPKAFGFQMVSLANENNADMGIWSDLGSKVKNQSLLNRKYLVQSGSKTDGKFTMQWQAPATDKDTITFYFAGLAVNLNGNTAGDNSIVGKLALPVNTNVSSISDQSDNEKISIYPNPASDYLVIKNVKGSKFDIFNIAGKVVLSDAITNDKIDIQSLPSGTYVFAVKDAQNKMINKQTFVKQ